METIESRRLVRVLHQNVGDITHINDPWRKFFEPAELPSPGDNPATCIIAVEAANLRAKWLKFRRSSSNEDQLDLDTFEPTIESVFDLVNVASDAIQKKKKSTAAGKITAHFHKFCNMLESHSLLLKVLPDGNEYVSVLTGTLNAVIKASVNHECIAEQLSEALCAISKNIAECQAELEIFRTPAMLEKVGDLYAHIFIFFSSYMDWMMRRRAKRLLDSFNENLSRKFELDIKKIHERSTIIRNLVAQSSRAEIRATRLQVEEFTRDYRVGQEGSARHHAEMEYVAARIEQELIMARKEPRELKEEGRQVKELTSRLTHMLQERATTWIRDQHLRAVPRLRGRSTSPFRPFMYDEPTLTNQWIVDDVSLNSAHLEDYFHRDRVRLPHDPFSPHSFPTRVLQRLSDRTAGTTPSILWIDGPPLDADDLDNSVTLLAATFINMAAQSGLPVLSYFCELRRGEQIRESESPQSQATISLVYALVRQMVELLLPVFENDVDLSRQRFSRLDGSTHSWPDALELFTELVALMPDKVFCVIDGAHWLDERSTEGLLADLVQTLRESGFKVLVTTSGRSPFLRQAVADEEALTLELFDFAEGSADFNRTVLGMD
ncbi:hypothetical protein B0T18DRAFT_483923 [Schizothecium vesticola]|uniref:DUF7708 domain-containing protein n=1 Tax=Schizothecium vesticola TaxID=314040 RepID=A0AA40F8C0_9PEZI|nr:hypothetical protein B0T18DRAFT_483923 [Schizothecium vesticola]